MLSILTTVMLLLPAVQQEAAPTCPSQEPAKVCTEATAVAAAKADDKSCCEATAATSASLSSASCDSKVASLDYALASITQKLDAQEPECSKSACDSQKASECSTVASAECGAPTYSTVMLQIDDCLKQTECDSNKECSDEAACTSTQPAALVSANACPSQQAQQASATCPSQQAAQQVVTLVAAQEPVSACSEVQAQSCETSKCATQASAVVACETSECATAECESNTVVTLVEEIVEEECSECCEEAIACEEIVVSNTNANGTFEFVVNTGDQAQVIEVCCEEVEEVCCEEVEEVCCEEATEVSLEVATAECCEEAAEACCDEQEVGFDLTSLRSLGYVGSGHGEKAMKVMIQIDGDVDNLDAQIAELLANIDVQQLGGNAVIRLDAGAHGNTRTGKGTDHAQMMRLHQLKGNNVVFGLADTSDEHCSECDDERSAPKVIQKRIELRRPAAAPQHDVRRPTVMQKRNEGQHHVEMRGGLTTSGNARVVEVAASSDHMQQRLEALENRLARMERLLDRLNERL
ncbi:MAG: hypothetical protein HQ519_07480 [Planctomycetes bacterium]|nr:hypothetical protein [Planctomycetota bacterium]